MKHKLLINTLIIFLAAAIAFVLVPLFMIGASSEDYKFITLEAFYKTALYYSLIVGISLSLINAPLQLLEYNKVSNVFVYFILSWFVLSGFIFSISASTGMIEPEDNPVNFLNFTIVLIGSILFSLASLTQLKKYVQVFIAVVVIVSSVTSIIAIYNSDSLKSSPVDSSFKLSNKKNIFVISFDGMPGKTISNIIKNNTKYSNALKDFIIFENAVSQAPATSASLIGDIYGVHDYKSKGSDIKLVRKTLKNEGYFSNLTSNYITDSFQHGYSGFEIKPIQLNNVVIESQNVIDTINFFKYPVIRMIGSIGLTTLYWDYFILPFKHHMQPNGKTASDIINRIKNHNGESWDKKNILQLTLFDSFVSSLSLSNKKISLRYLHFTFTHFPVDFDNKCKYRSDDKSWYKDNQNEKGLTDQGICAVGKFIEFLEKLKELKIYNSSLIVFKSDHGKPATYFSKHPDYLKINSHKLWGYNRYRPTLMIKDFEVNKTVPTSEFNLVLLNDIATTLCENSNIGNDCKKFNGVNLLGGSIDSDEPYFIYVVKNKKSRHKFSGHTSVKIHSRKISLLQAMGNADSISLSEPDKTE